VAVRWIVLLPALPASSVLDQTTTYCHPLASRSAQPICVSLAHGGTARGAPELLPPNGSRAEAA